MKRVRHLLKRHSPWLQKHARQMLKFAVCGGIGSVIDLGSLVIFVETFGMSDTLAILPSSILAIIFVFIANKFFTFGNKEKSVGVQVAKFILVYGVAFTLNLLISWFLLWIGVHYFLAKVLAIGSTALWNYSLSSGFVFRRRENDDVVVL